MPFISQLLGTRVVDADGVRLGKASEVIARQAKGKPHPQIVAIEIERGKQRHFVPIEHVATLFAPIIPLLHRIGDIQPYEHAEGDLHLVRDILDKQIIDTDGIRVVRVNDLEIIRLNGSYFLANVDIGSAGLWRRMGFTKAGSSARSMEKIKSGFISWDAVEIVSLDQPMRLKVPGDKVSELHPADLAEIISDLSRPEGSRLLQSLDNETIAETLEEVEPEFQASLIEEIPNERVADVLEEMSPDEAADLLAELPDQRSEEILRMMEPEDARDVRKLLAYPVNSAGGIMNTEFIAVPPTFTAAQVITHLRKISDEVETSNYVYVTEKDGRIIGVFSLRELILANPSALVSKFMEDYVVTVKLADDQDDVAQVIAKYDLQAVPVVDEHKRIHGIVTADDALDKIIPTGWKKRLPRFYH